MNLHVNCRQRPAPDLIEPLWRVGSGPQSISAAEVHLWKVDVGRRPQRIERFWRVLSEGERRRCDAIRVRREKETYCICHGYLRMLLGRYACGRPDEIRMVYGEYGKPRLAPSATDPGITFNLSHSGEILVIALARGREVGVDVQEVLAATPLEDISRRFFAPQEHASIHLQPEGGRAAPFYACWTRKEAVIKALGGSIARLSAEVVVTTDPGGPARLLRLPSSEDARGWTLQDLRVDGGYAGALCYGGPAASVHLWQEVDP